MCHHDYGQIMTTFPQPAWAEWFTWPLFDRLAKSVALTQAGEILYGATKEMMLALQLGEQKIEDLEAPAWVYHRWVT